MAYFKVFGYLTTNALPSNKLKNINNDLPSGDNSYKYFRHIMELFLLSVLLLVCVMRSNTDGLKNGLKPSVLLLIIKSNQKIVEKVEYCC